MLANDSSWRAAADEQGHAYFIHTTTGVTTYEMPGCIAREQLGHQRDCRERLMLALETLDAAQIAVEGAEAGGDADAELLALRAELAADLQVVERACAEAVDLDADAGSEWAGSLAAGFASDDGFNGIPVSAVELEAVLLRTDTNLARLESIGMERFGGVGTEDPSSVGGGRTGRSLWAVAQDGVRKPTSDSWSMVLEHVRRMRANLKPVAQAQRQEEEVSGDAWLRALKGKLRKVSVRKMTTS